jgi:hypothetical protein
VWTLTHKLAITLDAAYYMYPNWTLPQEHLVFDEVHNLFLGYFKFYLTIIAKESPYWSKASYIVEGSSGSFPAY